MPKASKHLRSCGSNMARGSTAAALAALAAAGAHRWEVAGRRSKARGTHMLLAAATAGATQPGRGCSGATSARGHAAALLQHESCPSWQQHYSQESDCITHTHTPAKTAVIIAMARRLALRRGSRRRCAGSRRQRRCITSGTHPPASAAAASSAAAGGCPAPSPAASAAGAGTAAPPASPAGSRTCGCAITRSLLHRICRSRAVGAWEGGSL